MLSSQEMIDDNILLIELKLMTNQKYKDVYIKQMQSILQLSRVTANQCIHANTVCTHRTTVHVYVCV